MSYIHDNVSNQKKFTNTKYLKTGIYGFNDKEKIYILGKPHDFRPHKTYGIIL